MSSGIRKNSRIAVDGLFLKRYPYWSQPNKKEKGFWQWTPLLVAPRAYLHWEPTPRGELLSQPEEQGFQLQKTVDELNPEFLEEQIFDVSKSGKGFRSLGSVRIAHEELARDLKGEKLGFEQLFQYVHDQGLQKLQTQTDERLHFGSLMVGDRAPRWARWQPCAVEGYVRFVERVHVSGLESGIEKFYLVTVTDGFLGDFDYNWTIAVLNLPYPMRAGDYVRTAGIFTKLYPYKSRMNDYRWTPLIVAPELKPAPREVARTPLWVYALGTVVILSVCAAIYFGVKREDARRKQLRDHLKEKRAARDAIRAVKRQQALNAAQESSDSSSDPLCDKRATEDDKEEN